MTPKPQAKTIDEKKNCMFQYAIGYKYLTNKILENTDLITLREAIDLWNKYLPDFVKRRENDDGDPEMVIWINCDSNSNYRDTLEHIDSENLVENGRVYEVKKREITQLKKIGGK